MGLEYILFLGLLMMVAFFYAGVGHGGASGYLALMALFSVAPEVMKPTALILNLLVAGVSFYHYYREGHFNLKLFLAFALTSIPAAFIGGTINMDPDLYKKILGILLIFAVLRMLNVFGKDNDSTKDFKIATALIIGGLIGFFSGLIGIGGGIILTPVILLLHWGNMKEAAAVSALFIWVNSAAGLLGQISSGISFKEDVWLMAILAFIGGFAGSYMGSKKLNNKKLTYMLTLVLITASIKLIFT